MQLIKARKYQSVKDIAIQYYGSSEAVWDILVLNPSLKFIDQNLGQGQELWVGDPVKPSVVNRLVELGEVSATAAEITSVNEFTNEFTNEFGE